MRGQGGDEMSNIRRKPKNSAKTENVQACPQCGGALVENERGRSCFSCDYKDWLQEDGTYTSGVAKCPECGQMSPNLFWCVYCSSPISDEAKKIKKTMEERVKN